MNEKYCKIFTLKLTESYERIDSKLQSGKFLLNGNYYILDVYMANKNNLMSKLNSINDLQDYLIIRDYNNENKELILFSDGVFRGEVKGIFSTKEIVQKLDYLELFNINQEVFIYIKDDIRIKVVNVRNLGIFIEYENEEDILSIENLLKELKIEYIASKDNYVDLSFNNYIKGKNL